MVKMLLVGYLYGIKSERRLTEDIALNLAYRWFCGFDLTDKIPDHSLFSQNRRRRFSDSQIFHEIFNHIVRLCIEKDIVTGESVVSDGSFIPANVAQSSITEIQQEVEQSTVHYLDALDDELRSRPGYKVPVVAKIEKIKNDTGLEINKLALDAGYDVGAVHRGLEILGIEGYVSCINFSYDVLKRKRYILAGK